MIGRRFSRLVVIARAGSQNGKRKWLCRCDCGTEKAIREDHLTSKGSRTVSCGCYARERKTTHGHRSGGWSPTYNTWRAMLARCRQRNSRNWHNYGGRGIRVCETWQDSFAAFLRDMGERPPDRTLDRIDPDGHYEPGNCRWSTSTEQEQNKRRYHQPEPEINPNMPKF